MMVRIRLAENIMGVISIALVQDSAKFAVGWAFALSAALRRIDVAQSLLHEETQR